MKQCGASVGVLSFFVLESQLVLTVVVVVSVTSRTEQPLGGLLCRSGRGLFPGHLQGGTDAPREGVMVLPQ